MYDDYYLLRFLRARKFDMEKTLLMFNTFVEWRKENGVDTILEVIRNISSNFSRLLTLRSTIKSKKCTLITIIRLIRRVAQSTLRGSEN